MNVEVKHPDWIDRADEWAEMRHTARGAKAVKEQGDLYLPMPSGFAAQGVAGQAMYKAYATRAQFPDIVAPTLRGMVGIVHRRETELEKSGQKKVDLPDTLQHLWERATRDGLPLEAFHRRITNEVLQTGRYSILVDVGTDGLPYLAGYTTEALTNWSEDRDFFVLDESSRARDGFEWRDFKRYRVLSLRNGRYVQQTYTGNDLAQGELIEPKKRGGAALDEIPLVVVGTTDLSVAPDDPPLIGVARSSLALYRLDAGYRHQLYMTGQETLVVINGDAPSVVGAGIVLVLKGAEGMQPDAKYVGPAGTGIAAHRAAIQDERDAAVAAGAKLFDSERKQAESGEALRIRYAAQTATLTSIAQASAAGLEKALRYAAMFVGADPNSIVVRPNLKFTDTAMTPAEAFDLVKVWQAGAISKQTLYDNLQRGEIASTERTLEDETKLIQAETPAFTNPTVDDYEAAPLAS